MNENQARLTDAPAVRRFVLAGNATFTLVSERTGARFTYKAGRPDGDATDRPVFFKVLTGDNNETDYSFIGTVFPRDGQPWQVKRSAKSRVSEHALSSKALDYLFGGLNRGVVAPDLQVWHEGRCCRCGRKLTVPESIAKGIGPECEQLVGGLLPSPTAA